MIYEKMAERQSKLDNQFKKWPKGNARRVSARGWIHAMRKALGMTSAQVAQRMGVAQATLSRMEKFEAKRTIQLGTLERVAHAMNCDLVYALVPRQPLETMFAEQLLHKAGRSVRLKPSHLEQGIYRSMLEGYAAKIPVAKVWEG